MNAVKINESREVTGIILSAWELEACSWDAEDSLVTLVVGKAVELWRWRGRIAGAYDLGGGQNTF